MVRLSVADATSGVELESVTLNVTCALVTGTVGVPVICPVELSVKPLGSVLPEANENVYGVVPPVAAKACE